MKRRSFPRLVPLLVVGLVLSACDDTSNGIDESVLGPSYLNVESQETVCTTVDFDGFTHGDAATSMNVLGVPLTLSSIRYPSLDAVDPTAYDVELTGDDLTALNDTHDDTQAERDCADCVGHGRILVVPDPDFAADGDNTGGGEIAISGFAADADGTWSIDAYDAVDGDPEQGFTVLEVDGVETASSTRTGNATVETVDVPANTITTGIDFLIGTPDIKASSGIDNLVLCRTTEEEGGGEGCTPGYWKQDHHFDSWPAPYTPSTYFDDVFGVGPHVTLLTALETGGGHANALGRHAVAALLSAASADVDYGMSVAEIIALVQDAYASGDYNGAKNTLAALNETYCPLN